MNTVKEANAGAEARKNNLNHRSRRWVQYSAAGALIAVIAAGMWPKPIPVEIAAAVSGPLRATVVEEGRTRIRERFLVSSPVAGQLERIPFKVGAEVEAGKTVVAVVRPVSPALLDARVRTQAQAKKDAALARLERARASHRLAISELKRIQELQAQGVISIQDLENVQWREEAASKEKTAAESDLRQAEADLQNFGGTSAASAVQPVDILAPATGRVLRVFEESSRVVAAGAPLLEVGDPSNLEVVIEVLSRDGARIPPGARVEFDHWGGDVLTGKIRLIEPAAFTKVSALGVEEQRVNAIADFITPSGQRNSLGDNFRVEARIILWETEQALKIPSAALFRQGGQWATFVVRNGKAALVQIKPGRTSDSETQILEGLLPGDKVILYPGDRVHDGQRVKEITI